MPLVPGTKLLLCDEQEGWLPSTSPFLRGTVKEALPGGAEENPLYLVELDEPIEIPTSSNLVSRGTPAGAYRTVVIKSRWKGFDVSTASSVSVYVLLPPPGAIAAGRAHLVTLPIIVWASCRPVASDA